jgi:hypothetical protein
MNVLRRWFFVLACGAGVLLMANLRTVAAGAVAGSADPAGNRPELAYLEQVNRWRPPSDPQLVFLLMGQFANAGRHAEGAAFFEDLRRRFRPPAE